jgi:hypothetical protein
MRVMRDIYLLNYLKTHRNVSKYSKDEIWNNFYAALLMLGKMTICLIYPILKLLDLFGLMYIFDEGSKIYFLGIAIIFFLIDYFYIEKKLNKISKEFNKKSESEIKKIRLKTRILIIGIVMINLFFMFIL